MKPLHSKAKKIQQVNLYLPELRPQREWLTANTIAFSSLGMIAVMVICFTVYHRSISSFEQRVEILEQKVVESESRVSKLKGLSRPVTAIELDIELERLRSSIAGREKIKKMLEGHDLGNDKGFSSKIKTLAKLSNGDFSLAHFRLSQGGEFVELSGKANKVEALPIYLDQLKHSRSFSKSKFGVLTIATAIDNGSAGIFRYAVGFDPVFEIASEREEVIVP